MLVCIQHISLPVAPLTTCISSGCPSAQRVPSVTMLPVQPRRDEASPVHLDSLTRARSVSGGPHQQSRTARQDDFSKRDTQLAIQGDGPNTQVAGTRFTVSLNFNDESLQPSASATGLSGVSKADFSRSDQQGPKFTNRSAMNRMPSSLIDQCVASKGKHRADAMCSDQ